MSAGHDRQRIAERSMDKGVSKVNLALSGWLTTLTAMDSGRSVRLVGAPADDWMRFENGHLMFADSSAADLAFAAFMLTMTSQLVTGRVPELWVADPSLAPLPPTDPHRVELRSWVLAGMRGAWTELSSGGLAEQALTLSRLADTALALDESPRLARYDANATEYQVLAVLFGRPASYRQLVTSCPSVGRGDLATIVLKYLTLGLLRWSGEATWTPLQNLTVMRHRQEVLGRIQQLRAALDELRNAPAFPLGAEPLDVWAHLAHATADGEPTNWNAPRFAAAPEPTANHTPAAEPVAFSSLESTEPVTTDLSYLQSPSWGSRLRSLFGRDTLAA